MSNSIFNEFQSCIPVGERTTSSDFSFFSNANHLKEVKNFAFFDSRARKIEPESSENYLARMLAKHWQENSEPSIIVTRTHASTTLITLANMLKQLPVQPALIVSNTGFVDCTPKKKEVLDDILVQAEWMASGKKRNVYALEDYVLSSGKHETVFALNWRDDVADLATQFNLQAGRFIFLRTHEVPPHVVFARQRPASFYSQLRETNLFLKNLTAEMSRAQLVELDFSEGILFDGVHFTEAGHKEVFRKLKKYLEPAQM